MAALMTSPWLFAGLAFLSIALCTVALAMGGEWLRERRQRRVALKRLQSNVPLAADDAAASARSLLRKARGGGWLGAAVARVPRLQDIDHLLYQAGIGWSVTTFLLIVGGMALAFGITALLLTNAWPSALASAAAGSLSPYLYVRRRRTRRLRAFEEQLPEALELLARAIRAGHPLSSGLGMVANEAGDPVAGEFRLVFEEQRFGLPFEESLLGLADRIDLVDVRIMVTAMLVQREVGGNLAEILDKIAATIRARFVVRRQLRAYTAQGRMSGYVLAALPITVGSIIFLLNPDYMLVMFREPIGIVMLVIAAVMQLIGFLWIRKIINIEI